MKNFEDHPTKTLISFVGLATLSWLYASEPYLYSQFHQPIKVEPEPFYDLSLPSGKNPDSAMV